MKVIFLDFDGTINLSGHDAKTATFDKVSVINLEMVLNKVSDARIVVSSSWRHGGLSMVKQILQNNGIDPRKVIDITGEEQSSDARDHRGYQIECWLKRNPNVKNLVILDDHDDFVPLKHKLVRTTMKEGFTQELAQQALDILNEAATPMEELVREHGLFRRCLAIYSHLDGDIALAKKVAGIIDEFIHAHHEEMEEKFLFPKLQGKFKAMGKHLEKEHEDGRELTRKILKSDDWKEIKRTIDAFIAKAGPHAGQEEVIVFPAFKDAVSIVDYKATGEALEREEKKLFRSFDEIVKEVLEIERSLGIEWK